jgi:hypothetical protein
MNKKDIFDVSLSFLIFSLVLSGCFSGIRTPRPPEPPVIDQPYDASRGAQLRIINKGSAYIHNLTVIFPENNIAFGDVPAGATTDYRLVSNGVYNYAAYRYFQNGQEITQPVIDWVGENPRAGKLFTYVIQYDPSKPKPEQIQLIEVRNDRGS